MRIFSIFLVFGFFSCSSNDNKSEGATSFSFGSKDFVIVEQNTLSTSDEQIEGTGSFVAKDALAATLSGNHFQVIGTLKESSTITLSANATDANKSGLQLNFLNSAGTLKVSMEFNGSSVDLSDKFTGKDAEAVSYHIDIHNDETPAHILIWDGSVNEFSEENALFNSEDGPSAPGNGAGSFWGMIVNDAKLSKIANGDVKFEEE